MARKGRRKRRRKPRRTSPRRKRIDWSSIRWGTLTMWLKKHRAAIRRECGDPFTRTGEINDNVLRCLKNKPGLVKRLSKSHYKRIMRKINFKLYVLGG